jgi:lipopolysaccharide export system protein LptC
MIAWSPHKQTKRVKLFLIAVVLITVSLVAIVYVGFRHISDTPTMILSTIREGADMSIGKIQQTSTRDGKKVWSLEASSAHYMDSENQLILKDLSVTFFLEDNSEVYLTAEKGNLNTKSHNIDVSGNVVITKDKYVITTDKMKYKHASRFIYSRDPVVISGESGKISADTASFDLKTNKITLEGKVEGTFKENSAL